MEKKVLITGVAGFLGSQLAKDLLAAGCVVVGVDNLLSGKFTNIKGLPEDRFIFKEMDACSRKLLTDPDLLNVQEIYHLASAASPKYYQASPFETINVNTIGTKYMLELAKRNQANIVYTSTSEAYGDPEVHPQPETYRGNVNTWGPRACYDEAKRLGEVLCYLYFTEYQTKVKVARIFNTYSAGLANDDGRVISNFVTQALKGEDITVYGDGTQTRSFCYVTDTLNGLKLLMEKDEANGEIINIGNPIEYPIIDLAHLVKALANSESNITFHPLPEDDPKVRRPVIEKAKELLGWEPLITLNSGLEETIKEYRRKIL
ncbi:NAD-dependent epimerase/dehydratase family protein [Bacillus sp. AFS031507]|uniref:NAD-dependent epimerase/dehydratase family protein n=1 Tax=Bacillus sp. AFS031507 TaxID=2033496 RepID=UPI000BFBDFF2|nr:NAD-dependent epimerase/dehydratase family protein [Bacillus sp. AFS031507]PGY09714.1 NAD-dependent dehydratase [Bacillus sp. AFS031507]